MLLNNILIIRILLDKNASYILNRKLAFFDSPLNPDIPPITFRDCCKSNTIIDCQLLRKCLL